MFHKRKSGFTLIELLVVIAIIGILATLAIVSLNSARMKSRDAKRISDMKQVQTALELYFNDQGYYPTEMTAGQALKSPDGLTTYLPQIPTNPKTADNTCPDNKEYVYAYNSQTGDYQINFCLGEKVNTVNAGDNCLTKDGFKACVSPITRDGLTAEYLFNGDANDTSGNNHHGIVNGATLTSGIKNDNNSAYYFNGSTYLSFNSLFMNANQHKTISAWILSESTNRAYVVAGYGSAVNRFTIYTQDLHAYGDIGTTIFAPCDWYNELNKWHNVTITYSTAGTSLYVNGALCRQRSELNPVDVNGFWIGRNDYQPPYFGHIGKVDNLRIYNRDLTEDEIKIIYNTEKP